MTPGGKAGLPIRSAVITVSDRCARGEMTDTSGPALADLLRAKLGAEVADVVVVPDSIAAITSAIRRAVANGQELVLTTGGTGCAPRDVTPEATSALIERPVPGLAERMRAAGASHTPLAWLSRGLAGVCARTLIVNLPGSRAGATESLEAIVDLLPHAIDLLRGDATHPAAGAGR